MSTSLVQVDPPPEPPFALTQVQAKLRQMVLDSVRSIHSKRNYAKALDDLFAFSASRPLARALLMAERMAATWSKSSFFSAIPRSRRRNATSAPSSRSRSQ